MNSARSLRKFAVVCLLMVLPMLAPMLAAGQIDNYAPVTDERLTNPEPENWLMYRRTYDSWGYSPLDKINASNVKQLFPV